MFLSSILFLLPDVACPSVINILLNVQLGYLFLTECIYSQVLFNAHSIFVLPRGSILSINANIKSISSFLLICFLSIILSNLSSNINIVKYKLSEEIL